MSCSKWRWTPRCDGRPCVGDCDFCDYEPDIDPWEDVPINDDIEPDWDNAIVIEIKEY